MTTQMIMMRTEEKGGIAWSVDWATANACERRQRYLLKTFNHFFQSVWFDTQCYPLWVSRINYLENVKLDQFNAVENESIWII